MNQTPWEANSSAISQEIRCFSRNTKVHYRIHNNVLLILIPRQTNPIQNFVIFIYDPPQKSARFLTATAMHMRYALLGHDVAYRNVGKLSPLHAEYYTRRWTGTAQSAQRLAKGWTVRGSNPGGVKIFHTCPDRPWGPLNLPYNGYRVFPGGEAAGAWRWPSTPI